MESTDVCTANEASGSKRPPVDDDDDFDLEKELEKALEVEDRVAKYHEAMRRALVDWGDDIFDIFCAKFGDTPKTRAQIEAIRKDMIDPLREKIT